MAEELNNTEDVRENVQEEEVQLVQADISVDTANEELFNEPVRPVIEEEPAIEIDPVDELIQNQEGFKAEESNFGFDKPSMEPTKAEFKEVKDTRTSEQIEQEDSFNKKTADYWKTTKQWFKDPALMDDRFDGGYDKFIQDAGILDGDAFKKEMLNSMFISSVIGVDPEDVMENYSKWEELATPIFQTMGIEQDSFKGPDNFNKAATEFMRIREARSKLHTSKINHAYSWAIDNALESDTFGGVDDYNRLARNDEGYDENAVDDNTISWVMAHDHARRTISPYKDVINRLSKTIDADKFVVHNVNEFADALSGYNDEDVAMIFAIMDMKFRPKFEEKDEASAWEAMTNVGRSIARPTQMMFNNAGSEMTLAMQQLTQGRERDVIAGMSAEKSLLTFKKRAQNAKNDLSEVDGLISMHRGEIAKVDKEIEKGTAINYELEKRQDSLNAIKGYENSKGAIENRIKSANAEIDELNSLILTEEESFNVTKTIKNMNRIKRIANNFTTGKVDPLRVQLENVNKTLGKFEKGLYGFTESVPLMIASINPATMPLAYNEFRTRSQAEYESRGYTADESRTMAGASAVSEVLLERISGQMLLSSIPGASKVKNAAFKKLSESTIAKFLSGGSRIGRAGKVFAFETSQELVQDSASQAFIPKMAELLDEQFTKSNFSENMKEVYDQTLSETVYSTFWMAVIGLGGKSGDISYSKLNKMDPMLQEQILGDLVTLQLGGISEKDARNIATETNKERQHEMYLDAYENRRVPTVGEQRKILDAKLSPEAKFNRERMIKKATALGGKFEGVTVEDIHRTRLQTQAEVESQVNKFEKAQAETDITVDETVVTEQELTEDNVNVLSESLGLVADDVKVKNQMGSDLISEGFSEIKGLFKSDGKLRDITSIPVEAIDAMTKIGRGLVLKGEALTQQAFQNFLDKNDINVDKSVVTKAWNQVRKEAKADVKAHPVKKQQVVFDAGIEVGKIKTTKEAQTELIKAETMHDELMKRGFEEQAKVFEKRIKEIKDRHGREAKKRRVKAKADRELRKQSVEDFKKVVNEMPQNVRSRADKHLKKLVNAKNQAEANRIINNMRRELNEIVTTKKQNKLLDNSFKKLIKTGKSKAKANLAIADGFTVGELMKDVEGYMKLNESEYNAEVERLEKVASSDDVNESMKAITRLKFIGISGHWRTKKAGDKQVAIMQMNDFIEVQAEEIAKREAELKANRDMMSEGIASGRKALTKDTRKRGGKKAPFLDFSIKSTHDKLEILFQNETNPEILKVKKDLQKKLVLANIQEHTMLRHTGRGLESMLKGLFGKSKNDISNGLKAFNKEVENHNITRLDKKTGERVSIDSAMSQGEAVQMLLSMQQEDYQTNNKFWGYDETTVSEIDSFLTKDSKAIMSWLEEQYNSDDNYNAVNDVNRSIFGTTLDQKDKYAPAVLKRKSTDDNQDNFFGQYDSPIGVNASSTVARRSNVNNYNTDIGALEVYRKHMSEVAHYVSHAELMRDMRSTVGSGKVKDIIDSRLGFKYNASMNKRMDVLAAGKLKDMNGIANLVRNVTTLKGLSYNFGVGIKQLTSLPAYYENISFGELVATLSGDGAMSWSEAMGVIAKSDFVKNRFSTGFEHEMSNAISSLQKSPNMLKRAMTGGMIVGKLGDIGPVILGGSVVYAVEYNKSIKAGMTEKQAHDEAMLKFAIETELAQQSSAIKDLADFQLSNPFARLFTMFTTSQRQYYNKMSMAVRNYKAGKISKGQLVKSLSIYGVILPAMFQATADTIKYAMGADDDEVYQWEDYLTIVALSPISGWLFAGQMIDFFLDAMTGKRPAQGLTPAYSMTKDLMFELPKDIKDQVENTVKNGEFDWKDVGEDASKHGAKWLAPVRDLRKIHKNWDTIEERYGN